MRTVRAYIGLGANLGDRAKTIARALELLRDVPGIRVRRRSRLRATEPVGTGGPRFLNGVVAVDTRLAPRALLKSLHAIEARLGRTRPWRWAPRTIDLDLLVFGRRVVRSRALTLPHPRLASREFVLRPLAELVPRLRVPGQRRTVRTLLEQVNR